MSVFERLTDLAACLCAQIEADGGPPTCFCGVIPGDAAVGDYAGDCDEKCGMAWVRLIMAYPATGVGAPDETVGNCSASLGFDVEVGILRCIDVPEDGSAPPAEEQVATTQLQVADMMTMWRAINCCEALPNKDFILGAYQPMGPLGALVGGNFTLRTVL
jgi:hypothetical protein